MVILTGVTAVIVLAVVLVLGAKIDALRGTPRSRWLSFAGGMAIAYVFLTLLPELVKAQQTIQDHHSSGGWIWKHVLFLVALAGSGVLFGIERAAKTTKQRREAHADEQQSEVRSAAWVFWLHILLIGVYVAFIGYLLFRHDQRLPAVATLGLLMTVHFGGIAVALADDYHSLYMRLGRWILAVATLAGGIVGYTWKMPQMAFDLILAVLAGGVIFNVIKEEIPPEQQSKAWALAVGAVAGGLLLWASG